MRRPGPICVTTAPPNDPGTLNCGRTISPAERHGHSGHENGKSNTRLVLHKMRVVQRSLVQLHAEYRKAVATVHRKPPKHSGKGKRPAAASPTLPTRPPSLMSRGGPTAKMSGQSEDLDKGGLWESIHEHAMPIVPAVFDSAKEKMVPLGKRLLKSDVKELEQICDDIGKLIVQMYEQAQSLRMSPLTRVSGRSLTSLYGLGERLIARCEGLLKLLEGLKLVFEYVGPLIVLCDLWNNPIELWRAFKDHELHDGGRTVAFHITELLILSFVGTFAVLAALGITLELTAFASLVGLCAFPLLFLKPPKGYQGTAMDKALKDARGSGHAYSKEYMDAVHKYLHGPSPANLINLEALEHAM
jgi:hypothetical protein